ncbi:valine--tRNA ligase [Buchnera aphidicola]|uniref:valine--tRNA ligase n=1 Tax=Buchnera aphidicola TaxID=9 RepID=UPI003463D00D
MEKIYNPKNIEEKIYKNWEKKGFFKPTHDKNSNTFCIIMPPPNITGNLHMGHAFQQTIMDILIRYHRMQGDNTLWQMGLDHAGIATQTLILKKIQSENNQNIHDISKKQFLEKCWEWKNLLSCNIHSQIKRLGNSVDWDRTRFTLDRLSCQGVKKVFINLYENNLIYRKKKLSNWDIKLQTVISDLEVEHRVVTGKMWYIKYHILDVNKQHSKDNYLVVATTRPETLLGDTAIAVNPNDVRYKYLLGKFVIVPIINRCIPIISDAFVDMKKGTGCVKITPAHDFNDYHVALKNKLPIINIFTNSGKICNHLEIYDVLGNIIDIYEKTVPKYLKGLEKLQARKEIINILKEQKLIDCIKKEKITILYGDRSNSQIELLLTDQWYLRTSLLSQQAIKTILDDKIQFYPKQYKNMYLSWMRNIQDWCISRQLWWGHKIPAWYDNKGNIYVGENEKNIRKKYSLQKEIMLIQEKDVLDTWFSASLWTFLSLDWPHENNLLNMFHPTTVVVSGFDIIFFWIARMIMMTMYVIKDHCGYSQIPFKNIYITGLIKDELGYKMSKSKGNVVDPIDIIDGISLSALLKKRKSDHVYEKLHISIDDITKKKFPNGIQSFGADVLRFSFASLSSINRSLHWDLKQLQGYKKFCNKIWNACRFIMLNTKIEDIRKIENKKCDFFFNIWILAELNETIKIFRNALDTYRFDIATHSIYDFFWNKFCNWYLEIVKIIFTKYNDNIVLHTKYILIYVFENILRLLHPIIPFITEHLWKNIKNFLNIDDQTIMLRTFPKVKYNYLNNDSIKIMNLIQDIVIFIRTTRIQLNIHYTDLVSISIENLCLEYKNIFLFYENILKKIVFLKSIFILNKKHVIKNAIFSKNIHNIKVSIILDDFVNKKVKIFQLNKKILDLDKKIYKLKTLLENNNFLSQDNKKIINIKKEELKLLLLKRNSMVNKKNIYFN